MNEGKLSLICHLSYGQRGYGIDLLQVYIDCANER